MPAFAPLPEDDSVEESEKEQESATEDNESEGAEEKPETSDEENKVPYSRFRNVHTNWREAERKAAEAEERAQELERRLSERAEQRTFQSSETPEWWTRLYGDTPTVKDAYSIWAQNNKPLTKEEVREEARREWEEVQRGETRRINENLRTIDDTLEDLSINLGRELSEAEQGALLDIMDDYTPKDEDGMYLGPLFSADKAWEIYEMQSEAQKASVKAKRNKVGRFVSSGSNGEPSSSSAEADKTWQPNWDGWRRKV